MSGKLYGVGVGPGDPDLLTVKAARLLARVPVIAYPAPLDGDSLARGIAAPHLGQNQTEIPLRMAFNPERRADDVYDQGAAAIALHLEAGRDVAVLCEGDPFFFGSFVYLFARLGERFPMEVIPGVSSLTACAAAALHPLSARNDALLVIPAPRPEEDLERLLRAAESAAILKVGRHLPKVRRVLDRLGLLDHAVCVERAGQPGQRIRSLAMPSEDEAPYFSLILVHKRGRAWM